MAPAFLAMWTRGNSVVGPKEMSGTHSVCPQYQTRPGRPTLGGNAKPSIEVLKIVALGKSNREMAEALVITESTVKYHLRNILDKLHLDNRAQVIAYATKRDLGDTNRA